MKIRIAWIVRITTILTIVILVIIQNSFNDKPNESTTIKRASKTLLHFVIPVARGQQVLYEKFIRNFIKYISPEWDVRVFVINQVDNKPFNRSWLYNIGILKSVAEENASCIITHDVNVLLNDSIDYSMCSTPTAIWVESRCFQDRVSDNRPRLKIIQATPHHWRLSNGYRYTRTILNDEIDYLNFRIRSNMLQWRWKILQPSVAYTQFCKGIQTSLHWKNTQVPLDVSHSPFEWQQDGLDNIKYHIHNEFVDKYATKWIEVSEQPYLSETELRQLLLTNFSCPIVVPKYRLIFFHSEKSACTYWKRLLQYIQNIKIKHADIHNPGKNKLTYLRHFDRDTITSMMYNTSWIKAAFVRDPRERILSAYLHRVIANDHMLRKACHNDSETFAAFLEVIQTCKDTHWRSQVRAPAHFYKNMMIGKMEHITEFTELLLRKIGAWNRNTELWLKSKYIDALRHATDAKNKTMQYYNKEYEDMIFNMYRQDYEVFGFDRSYISNNTVK
jgi:hypothetical protein